MRLAEKNFADLTENARTTGKPARDVERWRHGHDAREINAAVGGANSVETAECCRYANGSTGIAADRKVALPGRHGAGRTAGGASGQSTERLRIGWRSVMGVGAGDAVKKFVADRFSGDVSAR